MQQDKSYQHGDANERKTATFRFEREFVFPVYFVEPIEFICVCDPPLHAHDDGYCFLFKSNVIRSSAAMSRSMTLSHLSSYLRRMYVTKLTETPGTNPMTPIYHQ